MAKHSTYSRAASVRYRRNINNSQYSAARTLQKIIATNKRHSDKSGPQVELKWHDKYGNLLAVPRQILPGVRGHRKGKQNATQCVIFREDFIHDSLT
jgi:hypothetical protein